MATSIYSDNIATKTNLSASEIAGSLALGAGKIYRYPENLGDKNTGDGHVPFVMFFPYERPTRFDGIFSADLAALDKLPEPKFCITLPLPSSAIKTKYSVQYESVNLEAAGAMASGITGLLENPGTAGANIGVTIADLIPKILQSEGAKKNPSKTESRMGTIGKMAGQARQSGGDNLFSTQAGVSKNLFTEQLFKTVDFRTHEFSYTFIPKRQSDSELIDKIIQTFRFYMLPSQSFGGGTTASALISYPYEFQILYSVRDTTFMLFPSVLESLDVDYGSDLDAPKFFRPTNGSSKSQYPMKTTISMKFRELVILSRERVQAPQEVIASDSETQNSTVKRYRF